MESKLVDKLADKTLTKTELLEKVEQDFGLLPQVVKGACSQKAGIRYGCSAVLLKLSERHPKELYPYVDSFIDLLDSKYRILTWNALAIISNLAIADKDKKIDGILDKYYGLMDDGYMVTVANIVGGSAKIAKAKPYLAQRITREILKVRDLQTTPHLTSECKRVIAENAIVSFDAFYDQIQDKESVISFVALHLDSPRRTLQVKAENFLKKHSK